MLMVVEAFGGGVLTYLEELSKSLSSNFDIYIAYGRRKQTPTDFKRHFGEQIHFIEVSHFQRAISLKEDVLALFELRQIVKQTNPDIIHLHSSKAGIIGRWGLNGNKRPLFYTPHGYSFLMEDASKLKRFVYWAIEKVSAFRNCTTIGCSAGEYAVAKRLNKNAELISNGVDTLEINKIMRSQGKSTTEEKSVVTLGRISAQKNPHMFNKIAERMPECNFIWIGDGELRGELTASNISITGWIEREKAVAILSTAAAFVLPSLWEGLPISLLEAMYLRRLCIVSNVVGNRDVIQNNINGFVCESTDDYINAIRIATKSEGRQLASQAHNDILEKYNTIKMSNEYRQIYESHLSN